MTQSFPTLLYLGGLAFTLYGIMSLYRAYRLRSKLRASRRGPYVRSPEQPRTMKFQILSGPLKRRQIVLMVSGAILGLLVIMGEPVTHWDISVQMLIVLLFTGLGYRLPSIQDEAQQKKRRQEIEDDLPGVIDLLVIMLDAGATFDDALSRLLADKHFRDRPIKRELGQLASELAISPDRQAAFQKFSYASQIENLRHFTTVLIQSELYGTPVSKGLRGLVLEMRQKQFSAIEAKSGSLGPKLTIPMTLFFLPLIFIIVLAPTLIRAFKLS